MAKQGKRISQRSKAGIQAKYEAGLMSLDEIARRHHAARKTIIGMAKEGGWERGKVTAKVTGKLQARAVKKLIEKEGDKLFDYTSEYIDNVRNIDKANKANLGSYISAVIEARNAKDGDGNPKPRRLTKSEIEAFKMAQQFLKLSAETSKINFEGVRLAMGLDKPPDNPGGKTEKIEIEFV